MTLQSPRIYTYKITFEEVPYYYYGVKKEKYFNEEYWGSPKTNKWCWELYTPKKQILEVFDYTVEGYIEAQKVEARLISPSLNDIWCLNACCNGRFSLDVCSANGKKSYELKIGLHKYKKPERVDLSRKGGKISGKKNKEQKRGIFSLTEEQNLENRKKGGLIAGNKSKEKKTGIFGMSEEEKIKNCVRGGKVMGNIHKENGTGIFSLTPEQNRKNGLKGGSKAYELGVGAHSLTTEQRRENVKKTNSQRWMCLETGYISTPAGLSRYQKSRNIDCNNRIRLN